MSVQASHTRINGMPLMTCPLHPMQAASAGLRVDFIAVHWCALCPITCTVNVTGEPLQSTSQCMHSWGEGLLILLTLPQ